MNWFERYGIPGTYFVLMVTSLGLSAFWPDIVREWCHIRAAAGAIVAVAIAASIPLGYILSVASQRLYYTFVYKWCHVHVPAWRWAWRNGENLKGDQAEPPASNSEWRVEAAATFVARWKHKYLGPDGLQRSRFMQEWFMKRFDVMAINSAMILGTVIAVVLAIVGWGRGWFPYDRLAPWVWGGVCVVVAVVLIASNRLLSKQAVRLAREHFRDLNSRKELRDALRCAH